MKFTCDSCGAQYMIGDEKLGQRGVKVRCKKCSYVIILRPPGYQASKKAGPPAPPITGDIDEPPSKERPITLPEEAVAPTTPQSAPFATAGDVMSSQHLPADVVHETSSDLGLSKDFKAMGFETNDLDKEQSSPFQTGASRIGGSLAEPMRDREEDGETVATDGPPTSRFLSPRKAAAEIAAQAAAQKAGRSLGLLGASLPQLNPDDDGHESTSIENKTIANPTIDDDDQPFGDDMNSSELTVPGNIDEPLDARPNGRRLGDDVLESKSFEERISALDKNELEDMESSLNQALSTQEKKKPAPKPRAAMGEGGDEVTDSEHRQANLASLNALAQDSFDLRAAAQRGISFAQPRIVATGNGHKADPMLDTEIGSAFDAMFSPASAATLAYQEGALQANTVQESSTPDKFGIGFSDPEANKKPTRIFDVHAMQQVQTEQDIASGTNGHKVSTAESVEWYVAIDDEQIGPLSFDDVQGRWDREEIGPHSLCWKVGMGDWQPIRAVQELERLGDMDDRARTVVARIEPNNEDSLPPPGAPPIAMPEDAPEFGDSQAREKEEHDEPSWRPSAASALASLAAEELGDITKPKGEKKSDVAIGRALPATTDALEKLLHGDSSHASAAASPFGASEQSSSSIRPLPKRSEVMSSVSLRDPIKERTKPNYLLLAVIIGGFFVVAAAIIAVGVVLTKAPPPAPVTPPGTGAVAAAANAQGAVAGNPAAANPAANVAAANPNPGANPGTAANPGTGAVAQNPAVANAAEPPKEADPKKAAAADDDEKKRPRRAGLRANGGTGLGGGAGRKALAKEEKKPEVAAPPKEETPKNEEDDLLKIGEGKRKRLPQLEEPTGLPKQLEDSDILGVMRKNGESIKNCLTKQHSADPSLEGVMTVNYIIEGSGQTKRWTVTPDKFKTAVIGKCVIDAVKTWRFPQFSGRPMPVDFPVRVRGK
jgi:predicted Zn finger-like uncharacterized protein